MNKIFYKKGSQKNYKMYIAIDWLLRILILVFVALLIFFRDKIIIVGLIISFILWLIWHLKIEITLIKNLSFNAYVLNKETDEFYKVGVYPNFVGALPTEEDFMQDKHFLYDAYSFKFNLSSLFKDYTGRMNFADTLGANSLLMALSRLHNEKYLLKQLNKKNPIETIYKITKIYSVDFVEEKNVYLVVCDAIKLNNNKVIEKIEMYVNKDFDINNEIKQYMENICTNEK